jgi:hypothetical protein
LYKEVQAQQRFKIKMDYNKLLLLPTLIDSECVSIPTTAIDKKAVGEGEIVTILEDSSQSLKHQRGSNKYKEK